LNTEYLLDNILAMLNFWDIVIVLQ
jgi:hypothetical protein